MKFDDSIFSQAAIEISPPTTEHTNFTFTEELEDLFTQRIAEISPPTEDPNFHVKEEHEENSKILPIYIGRSICSKPDALTLNIFI